MTFIIIILQEYAEHPNVHQTNRFFARQYLDARKNDSHIKMRDVTVKIGERIYDQQIYAVDFLKQKE